eukprot:2574774-Rhodomonas_salina.2
MLEPDSGDAGMQWQWMERRTGPSVQPNTLSNGASDDRRYQVPSEFQCLLVGPADEHQASGRAVCLEGAAAFGKISGQVVVPCSESTVRH